jgi:hypothetical protein
LWFNGFRVQGVRFIVYGFCFLVSGLRFGVELRVDGLGFGVKGSRFRANGLGLMV